MKNWSMELDEWVDRYRPAALLALVAITILSFALVDWATGSNLAQQLLYPKRETVADVRFWSALVYALAFALGLPVAFLIWHWRDRNARDQIENVRKDINLKEFQEVQLRAAGALDEKLPEEAREQLQIAALHQLRGFLRGDYGDSFKRPAFELLLAGHAAAIERIGVPEVQKQIPGKSHWEIDNAVNTLRAKLKAADRARMLIIHEEARHFLTQLNYLNGRRFDFLNLSKLQFPEKFQMASSCFFGANLEMTNLSGTILRDANFQAAFLHKTNFKSSDLREIRLEGAFLYKASLERANLQGAIVNIDVKCDLATFDNETQFGDWESYTEAEKETVRTSWIKRGMINIDAPPG